MNSEKGKKYFGAIMMVLAICIISGCASAPKIDATEITSNAFDLKSINFYCFDRSFSINGQEYFAKLPLEEVLTTIETKYGIIINRELLKNTDSALSQIDYTQPSTWNVVSSSSSPQNIVIDLMVAAYEPNQIEANYTISYVTNSGEKKEIKNFYKLMSWKKKSGI